MFKNTKKLSEYSLLNEKLVYKVTQSTADKTPAMSTEAEKVPIMAAGLEALKKSVATDFREHLKKYKKKVIKFLESKEAKKYKPGEWKEWNVKLLDSMGFKDISAEDTKGIMTRLQEYLKTVDRNIIVDGEFGPNMLSALKDYYGNLDRKYGWVPGVTKVAFFDKKNAPYYLTHDGRWVDQNHKEINLKKVLPVLAVAQLNAKGYFKIKSLEGVTYFVDQQGNTYKNRMPDFEGAVDWNDDNPYLAPEVQGEEPESKKKPVPKAPVPKAPAPEKKDVTIDPIMVARKNGQTETYYKSSDGQYYDPNMKPIEASKVLELLAVATFKRPNGEKYYQVAENGAEVYYDEKGNRQKSGRPWDSKRMKKA